MYDYLAKVVLLGPSGAGKWVPCSWLLEVVDNLMLKPGPACYIDS